MNNYIFCCTICSMRPCRFDGNKYELLHIMSNGDNGGAINNEIMMAISEHYNMGTHPRKTIEAIPLSLAELKAFTGQYKLNKNNNFILKFKVFDGQLKVKAANEDQFSRLVPTQKMTFVNVESRRGPFVFRKDDAGKVSGVRVAKRFKFNKID